ncbi:MAG: hypothetical protein ACWA5P_11835 [bacterium]
MKKITLVAWLLLFACISAHAQQEKGIVGYNNWLNPWTEFKPNKIDYGTPTQILSGNITTDTKLRKREIYLLLGDVFVSDSTTLTIEPGTVIIGDFKTKGSLTISRGSKIIANGSQTDPIVFTSSRSVKKPGDWGGIFILGDAPLNSVNPEEVLNYGLKASVTNNIMYGGENEDSYSGIFNFVRIEYAGKRTKGFGYFNGLTLAGIGKQTIVENVMVSYCQGNSYSVLGGDVILDRLVSYKSSFNDYRFNYGAQVHIKNSLAVKSPYVSGAQPSKAMYATSYDSRDATDFTKDQTAVNAENMTLVNLSDNLAYDIKIGLVNEGVFVGPDASFSIDKSVISGFNPAVILDNKVVLNNENLEKIKFTRTYFNNCNGNIYKKNMSNNDDLENWYGAPIFDNVYSKGPDSETFIDAHNSRRPDFRLRINGIIASND